MHATSGRIHRRIPRRHSQTATAAFPSISPATSGSHGPLRILVVDDVSMNVRLLQRALEKDPSVSVDTGADGEDAIERVCAQRQRYDVVLMDENMVRVNGSVATAAIRKFETENGVPACGKTLVIAVTANALPEDRLRFAGSGMDGLIVKPVRISSVLADIRAFLAAREEVFEAERSGAKLGDEALAESHSDLFAWAGVPPAATTASPWGGDTGSSPAASPATSTGTAGGCSSGGQLWQLAPPPRVSSGAHATAAAAAFIERLATKAAVLPRMTSYRSGPEQAASRLKAAKQVGAIEVWPAVSSLAALLCG